MAARKQLTMTAVEIILGCAGRKKQRVFIMPQLLRERRATLPRRLFVERKIRERARAAFLFTRLHSGVFNILWNPGFYYYFFTAAPFLSFQLYTDIVSFALTHIAVVCLHQIIYMR
jgi:hypothetical protein